MVYFSHAHNGHREQQVITDRQVCNSYASEWLAEMREIESEGERTPAQSDPHPVVMDEATPSLLRKQAA